MTVRTLFISICLLGSLTGFGQEYPATTTADARMEAYNQRMASAQSSWFVNLPFTNFGPNVCSGRIVDVDVNPAKPSEMYVAYASGGVWYSNNNGTSFSPIFDKEATMTIGDIAVNWTTGVIWVGTGENNSSRSSYSGVGLYKSSDKGKTWQNKGLNESHHIGRIVLHPINPNIVHVACLGALYSANPNRGVYSTSDGGTTWRHSLYINSITGAIDLISDPSNPNVLIASTWERTRTAWNFMESGIGSGIYMSDDAGRTWDHISQDKSGFPTGKGVGRIGLEIVKNKNETILYAIVDNQDERPSKTTASDELTKAELNTMSVDAFLQLKDDMIKDYLSDNGFPEKYTVDTIKLLVKNGTIKPATLVEFTQDANSMLFDTEVIGTEIYKSTDKGRTWAKVHEGYLDNIFYTYGYYFGQIRASKINPQKLYILGVPLLRSEDGGATWKSIGGGSVHADHHALWVNPKLDGHLISGNDGGLNISYDDGENWIKCNHPQVGQFYSVNVDMQKPYNVYGGLQDNGVWYGPSTASSGNRWHATGQHPFKEIMGGDGMQVAIDTRDNNTVYTGFQFGNYYRITIDESKSEQSITPSHDLGQRPYRWNWESPIHLSVHNQDILYMGADRVFMSFDQGKNFKPISADLTMGGKPGDVAYGTLVSLHESPLKFGLIYAGSDDGYIHVTRDGGNTWNRISDNLPSSLWVSSLQASAHHEGRVYAALNGYRFDHFSSYLYMSDDYGNTWKRLGTDMPAEPVNVFKEDPVNPDILYIGTDHGLYVSIDRGQHTMLMGDIPYVAVHDLVIHPRDKEIVIATHGRSFYKADVSLVQKIKPSMADSLTCFNVKRTSYFSTRWGSRSAVWTDYYEPTVSFSVFTTIKGKAALELYADSLLVSVQEIELKKGLSDYTFHLELNKSTPEAFNKLIMEKNPDAKAGEKADNGKYYLLPGKYKAKLTQGGKETTFDLEIKHRG